MSESNSSSEYAELLADNLKAGRRFYYLILAVVIFLAATLVENDPARLPALQRALIACQRYDQTQLVAAATWKSLVNLAKSHEILGDNSFAIYQDSPSATVSWANAGDCRAAEERRNEPVGIKMNRAWSYLEALSGDSGSIVSMSTESGASEVLLPTERPSFVIETAFLRCFSALADDIAKKANVRVIGTAISGGQFDAKFMVTQDQPGQTKTDPGLAQTLEHSPTLAQIVFALNKDKLSDNYFKDLDAQYEDVRSSLVDLRLWDTATSVAYNPSVQFKGDPDSKEMIRDQSLLNSASLAKAISDLQAELRIRGKRLKVPLTSYEARLDVAVVLAGIVLLSLQLAYMFTLYNITVLASRVSKDRIRLFPWAILWLSNTSVAHKEDVILRFRPLIVALNLLHSFVAPAVLAWLAVSMLRFGGGFLTEVIVSIGCCLVSACLGYLSFLCIRTIHQLVSEHPALKTASAAGA